MSGHRTTPPPITRVTGGVAGLSARYAALEALADRFSAVAGRLRDRAAADAKLTVEPAIVATAPLSPVTYAEAEARLLDAAAGVHGALEAAAAYEADALLVRALVSAYQECDRGVAVSLDALEYAAGRAVGTAVRGLGTSLLPAGLVVGVTQQKMSARIRRRLDGLAEAMVEEHPELVQGAVESSGGLLDGLLGLPPLHPSEADAASGLADLYPREGDPEVWARADLTTPLGPTPPRSVTGLLRHLRQTNALSTTDRHGDQGTIEVQTLHGHDGTTRHIVYLPGTDDITTTPWGADDDVRDLPADLREVAGRHTSYAAGIRRAMHHAGIEPHDPVLLVGHSLGGMVAASMLAHRSGFDITHVVTAGSPVAGVSAYPDGTHVLSLENRGDVVPLLDGHDNPDSVQQVTVEFDDHPVGPGASVVGAHALRHYVHGAEAVDASDDASVREQVASLRRAGFLGSRHVATSRVFQIVRR